MSRRKIKNIDAPISNRDSIIFPVPILQNPDSLSPMNGLYREFEMGPIKGLSEFVVGPMDLRSEYPLVSSSFHCSENS
jgi:hypothetical protein